MTKCQFCRALVVDMAAHYGSDECTALVGALGPITAAGRKRERDTHYRTDSMERAAKDMHEHAGQIRGRRQARVMGKLTARAK